MSIDFVKSILPSSHGMYICTEFGKEASIINLTFPPVSKNEPRALNLKDFPPSNFNYHPTTCRYLAVISIKL